MNNNRINQLFEQHPDHLLSIYFCAGCPTLDGTADVVRALQRNGVDMIEIGIPFSDPMADGIVIQEAATRALRNGMSLRLLFSQLKDIRRDVHIPLILMGYLNPIMQFGFEDFCRQCVACGIDGVISEIKKRVNIRIQSGGGLRRIVDIRRRLDAGADRAVIGTMAAYHPDDFALATYEFPEKIVAGIDAKDGMFAVKGWTETTEISAVDFAKKCKNMRIRWALFTDISKDGAMLGPNICETVRMHKETGLSVIASGGISAMKDLENLQESGVYGAVLGKSIYSGAIDLKEAIQKFSGHAE